MKTISISIIGYDLNSYFISLYLLNNLKNIQINLIEIKSENEYDISTRNITALVNACDIDSLDFIHKTNSIYKISNAIEHNNNIKQYNKHFVDGIEHSINKKDILDILENYYENSFDNNFEYIDRILYPIINLCDFNLFSTTLGNYSIYKNSSYQLNTAKTKSYLKQKCASFENFIHYSNYSKLNIQYNQSSSTEIESIMIDDKLILSELYIDTSSTDKVLSKKEQAFISLENIINTNCYVNSKVKYNNERKEILPYTKIIGIDDGWIQNIPTFFYNNINFSYNKNYSTNDYFNYLKSYQIIDQQTFYYKAGYYENSWNGNVIKIGNSLYKLDPIYDDPFLVTEHLLNKLKSILINNSTPTELDSIEFNKLYQKIIRKKIYQSIKKYYHIYKRNDCAFWKTFVSKNHFDEFESYYNEFETHNLDKKTEHYLNNISNIFYIFNNHTKKIEKYTSKYINYHQWLKNYIFEKE